MGGFKDFTNSAAGGAAAGGLMDGIGSLFTIGAQKRAASTAYKRQNEFWDRQNAYNTPKAQMQRLKDAGLNPALMYGQGNTGNAQNLSGVQKANVQGPQLAQSAAAGAQMSLLNQQKQLMKEQGKAALINASANFRNSLTSRKKYKLDKAVTPYTIQSMQTGIDKMNQEITESQARITNITVDNQLKSSGIKVNNKQSKLLVQQARVQASQADLNLEVLKEYKQGYSKNYLKTVGEFLGMPDIQKASAWDKAKAVLSAATLLGTGSIFRAPAAIIKALKGPGKKIIKEVVRNKTININK